MGNATGGGGTFTDNNYLVLTNAASLTTVRVGQTSNLTADLRHDNHGTDVSAADPGMPAFTGGDPGQAALTVGYSSVDGTDSNEEASIQSDDEVATATFTGTAPGSGRSTATVDGVSVAAAISVVAPDLAVTMSHTDPFHQGDTADTYTIDVHNLGTASTDGTLVTVTDVLPTGLTPTAADTNSNLNSWNVSFSGQTITATRSDVLGINQSYGALTLTVAVAQSATSPVTNTATASGGGNFPNANNTANDLTNITPLADLTITKTDNAGGSSNGTTGTVIPGNPLTYTIVVSNTGPSDAPGTVVSDMFPANFTGASWTTAAIGGATDTNGTGSGNLSDTVDLLAGSTITYTVTGTVSSSATGTLSNTATVAAGVGVTDSNPTTSATDTDNLTPSADLSAVITGPATIIAGQNETYTITFHNAGPSDAQATLLTVDVPNNTTFVSIHQDSGPPLGGAFAAGATSTFTFVAHVDSNTPDGTVITGKVIASSATNDQNSANNMSSVNTTVHAQADLTITKTDSGGGNSGGTVGTATPGSALTYTITVSNTGPSDAPGTVVSDMFPADFTGASWTTAATGGATDTNGNGTGNLSDTVDLLANSSITYTVTGTVSSSATGTLSNTATVTPGAGVTDSNPTTSATDTDNLTPTANLTITKSDSGGGNSSGTTGTVIPGNALTYTIVVSNTGPSDAPGTTVADTLPTNFIETGYTSSATPGVSDTNGSGTGAINDTVTLPSGGSITYTVTGTVSSSATGALSNTASLTPGVGVTDSNPTTSATDTDNLTPTANLIITKSDSGGGNSSGTTGTVIPGDALTYTITVSNTGPAPRRGPSWPTRCRPTSSRPATPPLPAAGPPTPTAPARATSATR